MKARTVMRGLLAIFISLAVGFFLAFPTAILLAIVDLAMTGHGGDGIRREVIAEGIFRLSIADMILLGISFLGFALSLVIAWKYFVIAGKSN